MGLATGSRASLQTIGGQGIYVRVATSGVAYNGGTGIFSFNTTIQNLTDASFATANGSAKDAGGVQIFFHSGPTVTDGTGIITVANATGVATFTNGGQPYYQYGGTQTTIDSAALGIEGILGPAETSAAKTWQLSMPATVNAFTFQLLVSTETSKPSLVSQAPRFTSLDSDTLIVGNPVTATGVNFSTTPSQNIVKVGGQTAQVISATTTELSFIVPCVATGTAPLTVTTANMTSNAVTAPTKVPASKVRTLGVGEVLILENGLETPCNEITATQSPSKYIVSVFNANSSPAASAPYQLSGDPLGEGDGPTVGQDLGFLSPGGSSLRGAAAQTLGEDKHLQLLERNAQEYVRLKARFAGDKRMRYSRSVVTADVAVPPLNTTIRLPNINTNYCNTFIPVNATRVYYNGKIAIYEDDATADAFKAALNPTMQSYYNKIGEQFNADMEPVVRNNFSDILLRDAVTDNNGVLVALFTPKINTTFSGVAGFVVSCDQYPRDSAFSNGSSNFGQYFYAYMPTAVGTGYATFTPDSWYRTIRSTFIHESKHVASMSARVNNNAAFFEAAWLEEGGARMAEEMWAREAVYAPMAWKGNHGYGSAGDPRNIYCDVRPFTAECLTNTRAPVSILQRHFSSMYDAMFAQNARLLSPFGATASDNASYWYALSWSLIRYAIDQYGTSDAAFLTALTNSTSTGIDNLVARAGVSDSRLLGGWALSLAADDYPGLASPAGISQNKTWNLRNIYQGFNTDFSSGGSFTLPYPLVPTAVTFGSFNATTITTMRGGGMLWYEFSGTQTANQLLRLQSTSLGAPSPDLRLAIVRVQ